MCRYSRVHICENTHPGTGSSHDEKEKLGHADVIMLPLVFSPCPVCCKPTYMGLGRLLHLSLQIWAQLDWHLHNLWLPGTGLRQLNTNKKLTIYDGIQMPGTSNWFPGELVSCMSLRICPRSCLLENAWKLLAVRQQGAVTRIGKRGIAGRVTTVPGDAALLCGGVYLFARIGVWPRGGEEGPTWGNVCRKACNFNSGIRINYR